jgi:hypothetical protein
MWHGKLSIGEAQWWVALGACKVLSSVHTLTQQSGKKMCMRA